MEWLASIKFGVLEVELDVIELLDSKLEIFSVKDSTSCFSNFISLMCKNAVTTAVRFFRFITKDIK